MRWIWTLVALCTAGAAGLAFALMPKPAPLPVHVGGRVVKASDGSMRFGWPGVYFEARFRGTGVTVAADPGEDQLSLVIDGQEQVVLSKISPPRVTIDGLAPGEHVVRLEKLTESQKDSDGFIGFWPTNGGRPLPPPKPKARQIEFIGDSHTVGYGDTSTKRECTRAEVHDTTNTQLAYGPLLAKRLDADYRVIAFSGYGIVRNYDGGAPGDNLPKRYGRAIPGSEKPEEPSNWKPQVITIYLGTNDFSTDIKPGEPWADQAALHADYKAKYVDFVRMLAAKQPQAKIVLLAPPFFYPDVSEIAAAASMGARRPVTAVHMRQLELTGCDWHPSLADHRYIADLIEPLVLAALPRAD